MNQIVAKNNTHTEVILNFFEGNGVVDYFVKTFSLPEDYVRKNAVNFALKVKNLDLQNKNGKLLQQCSPQSKEQAFVTLLSWDMPTDARDLYYIYNVNGHMKVELSYKGLIYLASKQGVELRGDLIFEGDELETKETSEGDTYEIKRKNVFNRKKIIGAFVYARHLKKNGLPKIYTYSFDELEASRQASLKKMFNNESPAWKTFPNSMYLKSAFRKALGLILSGEVNDEIKHNLFDDEMDELPPQPQVQSNKTSEFASIEYDMAEAERVDDDFKQAQFEELKAQFDYRSEE